MFKNSKWIHTTKDIAVYKKKFTVKSNIKKAVLRITAIGNYECKINGKRVGDYYLAPGWVDTNYHVQYQEYDVTDMICVGENIFDAECGNGWVMSKMGLEEEKSIFADTVMVRFIIEIEYSDGKIESIISDADVDCYESEVIFTDIYDGETIDRSKNLAFLGKAIECENNVKIEPQIGEEIKIQNIVYPKEVIKTPKGETVVDFGQNMTGFVKVFAKGKKGAVIKLRHGEVLDKDGNFYIDNMRAAKVTAEYIMGSDEEVFEPKFSFYGFRYVCVDEFPEEPSKSNFVGIELHSNIKRTGNFVCGHQKLNQLYSNIIWGQKDNFLDVPTDCPQRNERLGWTGDAAAFVRTSAINFDVEKFYNKWLTDMRYNQLENGVIPAVIPDCIRRIPQPVSAAWGDVSTICPWEVYLAYGNKEILKDNFDMMKGWVEYIHNFGDEEFLWVGGEHFGDWLGLDAEEGSYVGATNKDYIASYYFAYSTSLLIKAGNALGKDMTKYEEMHKNIKKAIADKFFADGVPVYRTQTACALALRFDLAVDKCKTAKLLYDLLKENDFALTTGFVGTQHLLHALSENGYIDTAYDLLLREKYPSWLYSVNKGATTIWEHWDGIKEDGSFWSADMNSFNHYAYGAVFDWIFGVVMGIKVDEDGAGYSKITISPNPDKRLGFADTSIKTRNGLLSVSWKYFENTVRYDITIPNNTKAKVVLNDNSEYDLSEGTYVLYEG